MQAQLRDALQYLDGNMQEPQKLLDTISSLVRNSTLGEDKVNAILDKVNALVEVHKRALAIQKEVKERFPEGLDNEPEPFSESKQLLALIPRPQGDLSMEYTTRLAGIIATSPVPRNIAIELARIARILWCMHKEEDADCMQRLASGEARQLAAELRQLGRVHDAHTVEKLALDEGRSVSWKLQLELSHHKDPKMVELSKRIESLVTHAVLAQKESRDGPKGAIPSSPDASQKLPSGMVPSDFDSMEIQQQLKTSASGKTLALERLGPADPWRVREVDGVACELICGALQEVYPQLSFAEAMKHLDDADYDFEAAAHTLLHSSTPASPTLSDLKKTPPVPAPVFPADVSEILALFSYAMLLFVSFYAAHIFDSSQATLGSLPLLAK